MKTSRQELIIEIITTKTVITQNQLMEELKERGVKTTQATLSRDIRDLHIVKELSSSGVYKYAVGSRETPGDYDNRLKKIFRQSVVSYDTAQNLLVIKTLPGLASACCSALDGMDIPLLVGTIAGDDTAFVAMKTSEAAEALFKEIEDLV